MRYFKRHKDLIRHACKEAMVRNDNGEPPSWMSKRGIEPPEKLDFLQRCALKAKGIR